MKKIKQIKRTEVNDNYRLSFELEIFESIKKKDIESCHEVIALKNLINNLEFYREEIKNSIYNKFNAEIVEMMNNLLKYDK